MNNYKDLNDYEIMYMISENDEEATNLLFSKYQPIVIKYAKEYYKLGRRCGLELEDFIQEGYYALSCAIRNYDEEKNNIFYTYALVCIKSKMKNLLKRSSTGKNMVLNESLFLYDNIANTTKSLIDVLSDKKALSPELEIDGIVLTDKLKEMIYNLDFEESLICELKLNGFNYAEIATLLGRTRSSVYSAIKRFQKNLSIQIEKSIF